MKLQKQNLFTVSESQLEYLMQDSKSEEVFNHLAEHQGKAHLKRIISSGHTAPKTGWYCQEEREWVCVLQGSATLTLIELQNDPKSEYQVEMKAGDYLDIPAMVKHKVSFTSTSPHCIWLALYMS